MPHQSWPIDQDSRSAVIPYQDWTRQFWEIEPIGYHRSSISCACIWNSREIDDAFPRGCVCVCVWMTEKWEAEAHILLASKSCVISAFCCVLSVGTQVLRMHVLIHNTVLWFQALFCLSAVFASHLKPSTLLYELHCVRLCLNLLISFNNLTFFVHNPPRFLIVTVHHYGNSRTCKAHRRSRALGY